MNLPIQSEPAQRLSTGQASASRCEGPQFRASNADNSHGIEPDGIFDDIWSVAGPVLGNAAKAAIPALLGSI